MEKTKVLYVEDEPFLAKIVKESLESRAFAVHMEADGIKGLTAFRQFQPDICVLDVMLPKRDGFELGKAIRRLNPNIPIIFLTAKNQTADVVQGFQAGGNDYIRKPFSMEELIVRMSNLLHLVNGKPKSKTPNEFIPIGQYRFYALKYELCIGENSRKLSHREAELLKILTETPNFTVKRKDILKRVWGDDTFFNSRTLDVYITKLRDYLKEDPGVAIITLKGIGYHFSVTPPKDDATGVI